ncbi:MAG: hypothetical protein HFF46_10175 [Lawsonibacter sp.]|jgi:hypothetical protein|nr:hypothetical protein [Lawsonibacter sp.]
MWQKTPEELRQALAAPFSNGDIEWRVSATTQDKSKGLAVPYVTNRAIQNRLDSTVGIDGWQNEFRPWKDGKAQLCGISIYFHEQKQWLTKWDGADDSDFESVKGGLSDSMKRAAVEWGVGRYLYGMTQIWVKIVQRGKGFFIVDEEQPKLDKAHEDWVQKIRAKQSPHPQGGQGQPPAPGPAQPKQPQQDAAPQQTSQPGPAPAPVPQPQAPKTPGGISGLRDGSYLVCGAVLKPTVNGDSRMNVQLQTANGQKFQAYTHGPDTKLAPGVIIYNVKVSIRNSGGLTFYVLDAYELAADTAGQAA